MTKKKTIQECIEIRHLFWEFYVLNEIWFRLGDGAETYGYQPIHIVSESLRNKINFRFEEVTDRFFNSVLAALEYSIRGEMEYPFSDKPKRSTRDDAFGVFDREDFNLTLKDLDKYCHEYGFSPRQPAQTAPIALAQIAFKWDGWNSGYCGKRWAKACEVFLESKTQTKIQNKIFSIDRILDLYHNNGFLLNKTPFAVLDTLDASDLDERRDLASVTELIPLLDEESDYIFSIDEWNKTIEFTHHTFPLSKFTRNILLANNKKL